MPRRYALTAKRISLTSTYVSEHVFRLHGNRLVPNDYGIPEVVERTLTRLYGSPVVPDGRGEVAYWTLDDAGAVLGLKL